MGQMGEKDAVKVGTGNHRQEVASLSCSLAVILLLRVKGDEAACCPISSKSCFDDESKQRLRTKSPHI